MFFDVVRGKMDITKEIETKEKRNHDEHNEKSKQT
jgi:hypothetical protein